MFVFFYVFPVLLFSCEKERTRPYSGNAAAQEVGITSAELTILEDHFLFYVKEYGCKISDPPGRWQGADVLHKVRLRFSSRKKLKSVKFIPPQGSGTVDPTRLEAIDKCFEKASLSAIGMLFPEAPSAKTLTMSLPLEVGN